MGRQGRVYGGVQNDLKMLESVDNVEGLLLMTAIEMPTTFALDTATPPITIPATIYRSTREQQIQTDDRSPD